MAKQISNIPAIPGLPGLPGLPGIPGLGDIPGVGTGKKILKKGKKLLKKINPFAEGGLASAQRHRC